MMYLHTGVRPCSDVLHACDTPLCVNPAHLYLATEKRNAQDRHQRGRSWQEKVTHCPYGHELTPDNLDKCHLRYGKRACATCAKERKAAYKRRLKEVTKC